MKTFKALLFTLVTIPVLFFISAPSFSQEKKNESGSVQLSAAGLDSFFIKTIKARNYIGLGACMIKDGKIIWEGAYGYADLEAKKTLKKDNIFQLASLSKTVTVTALMQLYEKGLFKLDDDVNMYIPIKVRNPNFPDRPITFRMLFTHTASLFDALPNGNKISLGVWGDSPIPLAEFAEGLFTPGGKYYSADYFSSDEPGTKYRYSNISFSLIGYLVENMAKKDFSEYCKENIFRPLEMNNTGWHLKDLDTNNIVFGYGFPSSDESIAGYRKIRHFGAPGYPEGMLRTTLQDFSNFISAYINGGRFKDRQLLKPETVELILTPQGVKDIPSRAFVIKDIGLTWLIFDVDGQQLYSMNGFSGSIFTNAYFSQKDKFGFIYYFTGITMKNMQGMTDITRKLLRCVKGESL